MSEYKCSSKAVRAYKQLINAHLSRGVRDFTKYDISIRQGGLHYDRWEYAVGIHKPTSLVLPKQTTLTSSCYYFTLVFKHSNKAVSSDVFPLQLPTSGLKADQLHFQLTLGANTLFTNVIAHIASVNVFESGIELTIMRNKCLVSFEAFLTVTIVPRHKAETKVGHFTNQALIDHRDYDTDVDASRLNTVSYTIPPNYV